MGPVPASWVSQTPGTSRASFPLPMGGEPPTQTPGPHPRGPSQQVPAETRGHMGVGGGCAQVAAALCPAGIPQERKAGHWCWARLAPPPEFTALLPGSCSVTHQRPASPAAPPRRPHLAPGGASVLWEEPCEVATSRPLSPGPGLGRGGRGLGVGPPRAPPCAAPPPSPHLGTPSRAQSARSRPAR